MLLAILGPTVPVRAQDSPPVVDEPVATWSLRAPSVFRQGICPSGLDRVEATAEGLSLVVAGRCRDTSTAAAVTVESTGVVVADGEVSVDVRVPTGIERARLFLYARVQQDSVRSYYVMWDPGRGLAELRKATAANASVSLAARDDLPVRTADQWARVALVFDGPRMWAMLDGEPILAARDEAYDAGALAVSMSRLGSIDGDTQITSIWRDLRVAPLVGGLADRAPKIDGSLLPPPPITARVPLETIARDPMRAPTLFWPQICSTGNNVGTFGEDGLLMRVSGACYEAPRFGWIAARQPDVVVGDGEARVSFRIDDGWGQVAISLMLLDSSLSPDGTSLTAQIVPATHVAALLAESSNGVTVLSRKVLGETSLRPNAWTSFAVQRVGDQAWVLLDGEPVVAARGVPTSDGAVIVFVDRLAPADSSTVVAATLRDFSASTLEGADPNHGVTRAPRPVVDPRYDRILSFIRSDLVNAPGSDAQATELREIGRAILSMIDETQVNLAVRPLQEPIAAQFRDFARVVYVDERLMTYTPHVGTTLLLHEIVHAHQALVGEPRACVDAEVDAARWEARLWRAWFGPDGKQAPGDDIEKYLTGVVTLDNNGRLREAIEAAYHEQCAGR